MATPIPEALMMSGTPIESVMQVTSKSTRELAIAARGICKGFGKRFRRTEVLESIDLDIAKGEIFGILGPNGSGKTTLLSIFSTLLMPDRGELLILGLDGKRDAVRLREIINISSGASNFPWSLTVRENLRQSGMLYGLHGKGLSHAIDDAMETMDLWTFADVRFENLSSGIKQRLSLAKALLNRPRILFLDEPTTGLDPQIANKTRSMIKRIHTEQGITVLLTTHYMPEAEELCERVAFLRNGRIIALDTPTRLKRDLHLGQRMTIRFKGKVDKSALRAVPGLISATIEEGRADLMLERSEEGTSRLMKLFMDTEILDIRMEKPDLEDVFLELAR